MTSMTVFRATLGGLGVMGILSLGLHAAAIQREAAQPAAPPSAAASRGLIDQYCVSCHNDRLRPAGLSLKGRDAEHVTASPEIWERVVRKLRAGAMPPPQLP